MATGATIMSTTLPTVIGMGVVSKTTDTMFGKRGRRRTTTRTTRARSQVGSRRVHIGRRGGRYIVKKGRRIYI